MTASPPKDGRAATQPYRVRAGATWYWVDPTVPAASIEPGDTVVLYPAGGHAVIAIVQERAGQDALAFASLEGERFEVDRRDVAAMHLAAVDDQQ
jgi:hypothetical protein